LPDGDGPVRNDSDSCNSGCPGHILVASFIHVAAALTIARIMVPETGRKQQETSSAANSHKFHGCHRAGTMDGLTLLLNIIAMLVVMVALVHIANAIVGMLPNIGGQPLSFSEFSVSSWRLWFGFSVSLGPGTDGRIPDGNKTILNELLAFISWRNCPPAHG
jgi:CNT family concentrative nucleoside transporter